LTAGQTAARALRATPEELPLVAAAAGYFFLLLCGYYVLRPVRDEMAIQSGLATLPSLMTATFVSMLALSPGFSALAARLPRARLLAGVYCFFAANLVVFFCAFHYGWAPSWVARAFFVWLSVFNLFVVSVFWSLMTDLFSERQAERLFPVISAGGSVGAVCGPTLTGTLVGPLGVANLMLLSAACLLACLGCIRFLSRRGDALLERSRAAAEADGAGDAATAPHAERTRDAPSAPLGGSALGGIRMVLSSPYLLGISVYILMLTWTSVALYLEAAGAIASQTSSPVERTRLFARIDVIVNLFTFACQMFVTSRVLERLGLAAGLLFLPLLSVAGFGWLAVAPSLAAFVVFVAARRIAEYAVSRPAREALFTILDREAKYKAKNFIDTALTRGGEAASGWTVNAARALGAGAAQLAVVAVPVALVWSAVSLYLARRCAAPAASAASRP